MTPGPKFSTSTSARSAKRRRTLAPPGFFRSTTMPRLLRFIIRKEAASLPIRGGIMRRVSSPPGFFSTLITSAPMSARMSVQVGPAMTWVRSSTLRPASGPIISAPALRAAPLRRALVQERLHALAEILAHVAHEDQVLPFLAPQPFRQPPHGLLGGPERQGRMSRDEPRELVGAGVKPVQILDDF